MIFSPFLVYVSLSIAPHLRLLMEDSREIAAKRPLESSLPSIRIGGEAEAGADDVNPIRKRPCAARDDDSFEEFFALLKRIEATHRYLKSVKTVTSNTPWSLSFELEDFSNHRIGTRDAEHKAGNGRVQEEVVRQASKNLKSEACTNLDLEGLDLNSLPAELPLFHYVLGLGS